MNVHRCRFVDYNPHTVTTAEFSHPSSPKNLASPDLKLAVGRSNGDIEIWNPKHNWSHELTLPGSRDTSVEGVCWVLNEDDHQSPRLFSIGGSTYITEWDLSTGLPRANYDCNTGVIWSIAVNKSNNKLAVGCDDGSVCIIDISGGFGSLEYEMICQRQDLRVLSIKWFNDELLIGGCADARIRCWSYRKDTKGRILSTMRVDKSKTESTLVWSINVLNKTRQIVSGDSTGSVKFWDIDTATLSQSFKPHDADVLCVANDYDETKVFTAGVDRKIHQFNIVNQNKSNKWIHSVNRLLHSNDVRTLAVHETKGYNFLISGGSEKSIVIQSLNQFYDGKYRKIALSQQKSNLLVNEYQKMVVMWQDQLVKIWKLDDDNYKLVAKLSLSDDDNITSVSMNNEGDLLAISTMNYVKIFQLLPSLSKLLVNKIRDENFDSIISGGKKVILHNSNKLLILTDQEEFYQFIIDVENSVITLDKEIEFNDSTSTSKSKFNYNHCIKNLCINKVQDKLAISRFNGSIDIISLIDHHEPYTLTNLSDLPHLICFTDKDTLVILTEDNKLYEFYIKSSIGDSIDSLLTPWSKRNSEFLPKQFLNLQDKPEGIFCDGNKVWFHGKSWLSYFNLSINIPITKAFKNGTNKKRNRDGLTIEDDDDDDDNDESNLLELSLKQGQINKLKQQIQDNEDQQQEQQQQEEEEEEEKPFWISTKYRPILTANKFGDNEVIIIERPLSSLSSTPAFTVPKLKF